MKLLGKGKHELEFHFLHLIASRIYYVSQLSFSSITICPIQASEIVIARSRVIKINLSNLHNILCMVLDLALSFYTTHLSTLMLTLAQLTDSISAPNPLRPPHIPYALAFSVQSSEH
jgi:hypothetical protein